MIFIFGGRTFKGKGGVLEHYTCSNCQCTDTTEVFCQHSYYHFFYIPIFPNKRRFICQCTACGEIYELNITIEAPFKHLKQVYPNPLWMWAGTPMIVGLIFGIIYKEFYAK